MSISSEARFISFEGIDACGKSTQIRLLRERLDGRNIPSILVREPGGTHVSEAIRDILLHQPHDEMDGRTEALLMTASRAQLTREIIKPTLQAGTWVLADRYADSTLAYQGGGRGLDVNRLIELNRFATYDTQPQVTFFVDIHPEEGMRRMGQQQRDRIEKEGTDFQYRVRQAYLTLVDRFPERVVVVDGHQPVTTIHEALWTELERRHFVE